MLQQTQFDPTKNKQESVDVEIITFQTKEIFNTVQEKETIMTSEFHKQRHTHTRTHKINMQ